MPSRSPPALPALLACILLMGTWTACGSEGKPLLPKPICRDKLTQECIPCPGVEGCVDKVTCVPVLCSGSDISFGDKDVLSDAGDTVAGGDVQADGGPTDAGPVDSAGDAAGDSNADAGSGDTAADIAQINTNTGKDGGVVPCTVGQKTCLDDKSPAFCFQGGWLAAEPCKPGYACKQGSCACAGECLAIGQLQCLDKIPAYKSCQLVEGCLLWGVPLACKPGEVCKAGLCQPPAAGCTPACNKGETCQDGNCVAAGCNPACAAGQVCEGGKCVNKTFGTLSCNQIFACIDQFAKGPTDTVNIEACIAKGSATGQADYIKRKQCISLSCQTYIDQGKANEAMLCVYTYCAKEQVGCFGSGADNCQQLAGCLVNCGASTLCLYGCHASASETGAKDFYALQSCADQKCAGKTGPAWSACADQACKSFLAKCTGGTFSCAQILQCASGCTTKPCAQACKAKGSVQGLADLQKLLDCNQQSCGVACNQGTQQQCDACMSVFCKNQQAACS